MDPIVQLEREWRAVALTLAPRLRAWQRQEPALAPFSSPQLLVRFLQRYDADLDAKDAALAALLRRAQAEPAAARIVLQALLPGLKRLAQRLILNPHVIRAPQEREEIWSTLLTGCWQRIYSYPLTRRPQRIAANLLLDTRLAVRQERTLARARAESELALAELPLPPPRLLPLDLERPLRRAFAAAAISAEEAELILETRIDGASLAVLASARGLSYGALLVRRWRAERRLLLFLGAPRVRTEPRNRRSFSARVIGAGSEATAQRGA